jgi:hypothetical protein
MSNWCNVRLIVAGPRTAVLRFSRLAPLRRPSSIFEPDMLRGESAELSSSRVKRLKPNFLKKVYDFQVRHYSGIDHFRTVSRRYPVLRFVLVYGDPNANDYGSYFISRGRARSHRISGPHVEAVIARHGYTGEDGGDSDTDFWDVSFELMDLAEAHWKKSLVGKSLLGLVNGYRD